jgi:hypothetical protein
MIRENFKHGFTESDWEAAKEEAKRILVRRAKRGSPITYSDFVSQIVTVIMDAHDTRLAHFLGQISESEHFDGRPLLTALVVHKHDLWPGKGFFELARSLGYSVVDETAFWSDQVEKLKSYWKSVK